MSWTDERVEQLRAMWNDGKSASQIAKSLGGVTRNAVIGKVHRLGLSNRAGGPGKDDIRPAMAATDEAEAEPVETKEEVAEAVPTDPRTAAKEAPRRPPAPGMGQPLAGGPPHPDVNAEALASLAEIEKRARKLDLMQLTERTCKWPIGDPATEEFWFCGLPAQPGKPYCEAHVAVAFQPMSSRRDRRVGGR
ncbi:MAG TPA: GcrA family cell cycle regulator [Paracoccaceae bacterium]|nr:GcrA family cell cycle regulator [Paracoccaceae bacterium]